MRGLQVGLISTERGVCLHHLTLWVIFICHPTYWGGPTAVFFFFFPSPGARVLSMSCLNVIAPAIFHHDIAPNARLIPISVYNWRQWAVHHGYMWLLHGRWTFISRVSTLKKRLFSFQIFLDTESWQFLRALGEKYFLHLRVYSLPR